MDERLGAAQAAAKNSDWATVAFILQEVVAQKSSQGLERSTQQLLVNLALGCLSNGHFQTRWDISKVIPQLGAIALPALLPIVHTIDFDEEDWEYLWFAARLVGEFDHPDAIATLLTLLQSETPELVKVASDALANRGAVIVADVANLLSCPSARLGIAQTLAKIDHPSIIEPLLVLVDDGVAEVRAIALEALMRYADERIVSSLIRSLADPSARVRQAAVTGLGLQAQQVSSQDIVPLLEPLLLDFNGQVGRQAAIALGRLRTIEGLNALDRAWRSPYISEPLRHEMVQVMGRGQQEDALLMLQRYLEEQLGTTDVHAAPTQRLCHTIIATLGRVESPMLQSTATQILIESLHGQPSISQLPQLRQAIAFSLGQIGNAQAIEALIQLLADEDTGVRLHAIAALKQIDPTNTLKRLEDLSQDRSISPTLQQGTAFALAEWSR